MEKEHNPLTTEMSNLIHHMRHPSKKGLLTMVGDEDCDIPELTANFCFGAAQLEYPDILDRN
jgi:hypothetical protein